MIGWDGGRGGVKEMGAGYICVSQERYIAGYVGGGGGAVSAELLFFFLFSRAGFNQGAFTAWQGARQSKELATQSRLMSDSLTRL